VLTVVRAPSPYHKKHHPVRRYASVSATRARCGGERHESLREPSLSIRDNIDICDYYHLSDSAAKINLAESILSFFRKIRRKTRFSDPNKIFEKNL
jgi:hypothetical protein